MRSAQVPETAIGRFVRYHDRVDGGKNASTYDRELPAVITAVHGSSCVNLQVFRDDNSNGGLMHVRSSQLGTAPGEWSWPPRS